MNKKTLPVFFGVVVLLVVGIGLIIFQKSQVKAPVTKPAANGDEITIKKVDMASQPEWVQKLVVKVTGGTNPKNGLKTITITADGMPEGLVRSYNYVAQFETANLGTKGGLSFTPLEINGAKLLTKTFDLGSCSTKSCVRYDGVKEINLELDFTTTSGDQFTWSKVVPL